MGSQITDKPYEPNEDFASALQHLLDEARVTNQQSAVIRVPVGKLKQESYTVTLEKYELSGFTTITPASTMVSLRGDLGFASALALAYASQLGEISKSYMDQGTPASSVPEEYHDLTVEWYTPLVRESNIPMDRLRNRPLEYDTELVAIDEIEDWAQTWLSHHLGRDL